MKNSLVKQLEGRLKQEQERCERILKQALRISLDGLNARERHHATTVDDDGDENGAEPLAQHNLGHCTKTLPLVVAALARIKKGTYGYCPGCEGEISEKRLLAVPYAKYCIDCETLQQYGLPTPVEKGVAPLPSDPPPMPVRKKKK